MDLSKVKGESYTSITGEKRSLLLFNEQEIKKAEPIVKAWKA